MIGKEPEAMLVPTWWDDYAKISDDTAKLTAELKRDELRRAFWCQVYAAARTHAPSWHSADLARAADLDLAEYDKRWAK